MNNRDDTVVAGFGDEWTRFDQTGLPDAERKRWFEAYFAVFPWYRLDPTAVGFDLGCGSGRWAALVAPRVGRLLCVDASEAALAVARRNLEHLDNCELIHASVDGLPFADASMDFGYSLGVLHHVPDTRAGIAACVRKLKPGAPFLVYLYYAFDNRPGWFRVAWKLSDLLRGVVSRAPHGVRYALSQALAALLYWPLARGARWLERRGFEVTHLPLSAYRDSAFYVMRNDALDRFGTRLERRFTRAEIETLLHEAGLRDVRVHDGVPFWCAAGIKQ
ncbi:MAG: class I SAM-dependent methyltransferase [Thiotrichales bacterium]